jgi:hypothetical protein
VHARTPVATRKVKSRASLRIIQAITNSGSNAAERALALHLALINPAIREISKSTGFQNSNKKKVEYLKDQVKAFLGIVYETKKKHGNVNGDQNLMGATVLAALVPNVAEGADGTLVKDKAAPSHRATLTLMGMKKKSVTSTSESSILSV